MELDEIAFDKPEIVSVPGQTSHCIQTSMNCALQSLQKHKSLNICSLLFSRDYEEYIQHRRMFHVFCMWSPMN